MNGTRNFLLLSFTFLGNFGPRTEWWDVYTGTWQSPFLRSGGEPDLQPVVDVIKVATAVAYGRK